MRKIIFSLFFMLGLISVNWAQEIKVMDLDSFQAGISRSTDTVYVYNFWATWCGPCVKEMPYFEQLGEAYQGKKLKVVLISLDFPRQTQRVKDYVTKNNIQSEVWHLTESNANLWVNSIEPTWSGAIPATLIKGPQGISEFKEQSFESYTELNEWLTSTASQL